MFEEIFCAHMIYRSEYIIVTICLIVGPYFKGITSCFFAGISRAYFLAVGYPHSKDMPRFVAFYEQGTQIGSLRNAELWALHS